jgi:hypothetical protein
MVAAMDKVGVDGAIFISAFSMYRYDASYAVEVQQAYPGRFVIVKPVDPDDPAVWGLATRPADADRMVAFSLFDEVYVTEDAGTSWRKIAREFGEIRAAVWVPNQPRPLDR